MTETRLEIGLFSTYYGTATEATGHYKHVVGFTLIGPESHEFFQKRVGGITELPGKVQLEGIERILPISELIERRVTDFEFEEIPPGTYRLCGDEYTCHGLPTEFTSIIGELKERIKT